jgi:drug/metabolite transporter (DMT)-like permease
MLGEDVTVKRGNAGSDIVRQSEPAPRASWHAPVAIVVALALWASAFPAIRFGLRYFAPTDLVGLRMLVAALAFGIYCIARPVKLPAVKDIGRLALAGLTGMTIYQITLAIGETRVTAGSASLIVNSSPVITVLLAAVFLRERIPALAWVGIVVSFAGAGLIGLGESRGPHLHFQPAALIVLLSSFSTSVYLIVQKPLLSRYSAIEFTIYSIWFGALFAVPWMPHLIVSLPHAPRAAIWSLVYLGIVPTAIAYAAWSFGFARMELAKAVSSLYLIPIFAIAISFCWLREIPSTLSLLGGACSLIGVVIVTQMKERGRS